MGNKMKSMKILDKYTPCIGNNCINNNSILVKKVFRDLDCTPLCLACCKKHRTAIIKFKKASINLSNDEIVKVYFDTLNLK